MASIILVSKKFQYVVSASMEHRARNVCAALILGTSSVDMKDSGDDTFSMQASCNVSRLEFSIIFLISADSLMNESLMSSLGEKVSAGISEDIEDCDSLAIAFEDELDDGTKYIIIGFGSCIVSISYRINVRIRVLLQHYSIHAQLIFYEIHFFLARIFERRVKCHT